MHNLKVEKYVLFGGQSWGLKPGTQPLSSLWGTDPKGEGGAINYRSFLQQRPGNRNIERFLLIKENQTSRVNEFLVFFCVWEDAKVWAHWNPFFDMHLSYVGQYPVLSHPEFPRGAPSGEAVAVDC